jgi:hypothetical protein
VWPGEIPPGWELEWVDDDDSRHHGRPPVMFLASLSLISAVFKNLNFIVRSKTPVCNN